MAIDPNAVDVNGLKSLLKEMKHAEEREIKEREKDKEREKLRIKRRDWASDQLKIPSFLRRNPDSEWRLHQMAAGSIYAPNKPPRNWENMPRWRKQQMQQDWRRWSYYNEY